MQFGASVRSQGLLFVRPLDFVHQDYKSICIKGYTNDVM